MGVVNYGVGNHYSIRHALYKIDVRCRISDEIEQLDKCDILFLPGVGAFQPAMSALREKKLDIYIKDCAKNKKPIIGICLGMQLLGMASYEDGFESGLGVFKSEVNTPNNRFWHIGWNKLHVKSDDPMFVKSHGKYFYFNHAYMFPEHCIGEVCESRCKGVMFSSVIRQYNTIGMQFHPEKSQQAGEELLKNIIYNILIC